jgi:capsule polysaccharide export protein KpsE/RkpR
MARKFNTYYVSGVAQVTVRAVSAKEAVLMAQSITDRRNTKALYIELDNIASETRSAVGLDDAATLDEEE